MHLFRLLTLRSMRSRSFRFLLSAFGIILGVAGMLSIQATNQTALASILNLFESTSGRAKLAISSADTDEGGFSENILTKVNNMEGILVANPLVIENTDLADKEASDKLDISFFGASGGGLLIHGVVPSLEIQTRDYKLIAGRFLTEDLKTREIVLVENFAEDENIHVDNLIKIITPNGTKELKVVGLVAREGPGKTNNGSFGVIPLETAQELFNRSNDLDQIDIVPVNLNPSTTELAQLRAELQGQLGDNYSVTYPSGQGERMTQMLQNYQIGLNFMSGIALFVGAFLIYNAFAMTVVERTREFGMLRTVGMTRRQVIGTVLVEAGILGFVGSALGVGLGILLARGLTSLMETLMSQELGVVQVTPNDMLFSMSIGVGVTFLAALIPALQAGRISPIEALRVRGKTKEGWLIRYGWILGILLLGGSVALLIINPFPYDVQFRLGSMTVFGLFTGATLLIPITVGAWEIISRPIIKLIYGSSGSLGSRNVQRSKLRTTLTVAALMVGVAMVIMVRGMTESFAVDLRTWIQAYLGGDIYVTSSVRLRSDMERRLKSVEGVYEVAPLRYFNVDWKTPTGETETINFMAINVAAYSRVTSFVFSGEQVNPQQALERLQAGRAVFVSTVLAEKYNLTPGGIISLKTRRGYKDFEIAGVVVDFYNQGLVVQGNWEDMRRYFNIKDANTLLVKVDADIAASSVQEQIDAQLGERYHLILISNEMIRDQVLTLMDQAFSMFDVMALISIVVGSLGVINTLTMSVIERTREIGMLRAIGTTRGQIVRMVLAEAMLMGVIGGILGLGTGVVLARILFIGMTTMSGYRLTFVLPPEGVIISVVIAMIISQLAAIAPARRAAKVRILEAVHYE
ncbi:MAG: FtsX-like permease family protein [Anaerolineales bacterium]|nr:FtsX-like permease family protein [Anaerolineales bacterium]